MICHILSCVFILAHYDASVLFSDSKLEESFNILDLGHANLCPKGAHVKEPKSRNCVFKSNFISKLNARLLRQFLLTGSSTYALQVQVSIFLWILPH